MSKKTKMFEESVKRWQSTLDLVNEARWTSIPAEAAPEEKACLEIEDAVWEANEFGLPNAHSIEWDPNAEPHQNAGTLILTYADKPWTTGYAGGSDGPAEPEGFGEAWAESYADEAAEDLSAVAEALLSTEWRLKWKPEDIAAAYAEAEKDILEAVKDARRDPDAPSPFKRRHRGGGDYEEHYVDCVLRIPVEAAAASSINEKDAGKQSGEKIDESSWNLRDLEEVTIDDMLTAAKNAFPHNADAAKSSPIVGVVDGHLADFTHILYAKHEGRPDPGTFFLHDGAQASLDAIEEQFDIGGYGDDEVYECGLQQTAGSKEKKLDEWTEFHPSDKKNKYYIVVDYSNPPTNYAQFVTPDKQLTKDLSNGEFAKAAKTVVPETARQMAEHAVEKWGMPEGMYVFLYRDRYSVGRQTQLNHSRSNAVDIWSPQSFNWRYGLRALDQAERDLDEVDASDFVSGQADLNSFIPSRSQPAADWAAKMQDPEYREKWERKQELAAERRRKAAEEDPWAPKPERTPSKTSRQRRRLERSGTTSKKEEMPPAPPSILTADDAGEIHAGDLFHMLRARPANAGWTTMKVTD